MNTLRLIVTKILRSGIRLLVLVILGSPISLAAQENTNAIAVRNQVAQPASPVTTLRHWKIKKGSFPQFLRVSQEGVWPYFEKLGSRVVGMWVVLNVVPSDETGRLGSGYEVVTDSDNEYDEVYLMTRYASLDHWQATRNPIKMGGNGPDYDSMVDGLRIRQELTINTDVTFLQGFNGSNSPYFMPGTGEEFKAVESQH